MLLMGKGCHDVTELVGRGIVLNFEFYCLVSETGFLTIFPCYRVIFNMIAYFPLNKSDLSEILCRRSLLLDRQAPCHTSDGDQKHHNQAFSYNICSIVYSKLCV